MVEALVAAMERSGAQRAKYFRALGPTIGQQSYEVGPEFLERFSAEDAGFARFFKPSAQAGHFMFDLPGLIEARAERTESALSKTCASTPMRTRRAFSPTAA